MNTLKSNIEQFQFKEYLRILGNIIDETGFKKTQEAELLAWESTAIHYDTTVALVKKMAYASFNAYFTVLPARSLDSKPLVPYITEDA